MWKILLHGYILHVVGTVMHKYGTFGNVGSSMKFLLVPLTYKKGFSIVTTFVPLKVKKESHNFFRGLGSKSFSLIIKFQVHLRKQVCKRRFKYCNKIGQPPMWKCHLTKNQYVIELVWIGDHLEVYHMV
jgi:hypothetical protein